MSTDVDVLIVGAGPAGLSFARSLAGSGLRLGIVDPQSRADLAEPAFDGREIALTWRSIGIMQALGQWSRIDPAEISELRRAEVRNGRSSFSLGFGAPSADRPLGQLVPNHLIRRAAFEVVDAQAQLQWFEGRRVQQVSTGTETIAAGLDDGQQVSARLLVAADSRFSATRRAVGIGARMHDYGKSMMVCRMALQRDHDHVATEWFDYGQTVAMLPLNGRLGSLVLTLPHAQIEALRQLPEPAFNREMSRRVGERWGLMRQVGARCVYPLVGVMPERFVAPRFALIGDAAVGMHPVTAHGFNLGLEGQASLATALREANQAGRDFAAPQVLSAYQRAHRRACLPLFLGTETVVRLFTDDSRPARVLRDAALRLAQGLGPFRSVVQSQLMRA